MKRTGMKPISAKTKARVVQRDGAFCLYCGTNCFTEYHHLLNRTQFSDFINDPDNVIILCRQHHTQIHNDVDFKHELINKFNLQERTEKMIERDRQKKEEIILN